MDPQETKKEMDLVRTKNFRMKKSREYVGREERLVPTLTLQQLWIDVTNPKKGMWIDIPVVDTHRDIYDEAS